jgi:hypothetical protein
VRTRPPAARRARGRALLAVVAVVLLSACTGIPTEGPVVPGRPAGKDPNGPGLLQFIADGPQPGDTPDQTVIGFVRAASGFADDHRVARSFLSPSRRLGWRPDTSIDVYPGAVTPQAKVTQLTGVPTPTPSGSPGPATTAGGQARGEGSTPPRATVTVDVPVQATIDGDGRYTTMSPGKRRTVTYGLVQVNGNWRIDDVPDGIIISSADFSVTFRAYPVYFVDRGQQYLVPDIHWFASANASAVPTALVRALLAGPAPWLSEAVMSGAPTGTRMAVESVVVAAKTATIDLTGQAREATPQQRQLLALQLEETLSASVKITVDGADYDIPTGGWMDDASGERTSGPRRNPSVDSRPVVIDANGRIARLEGSAIEPVEGIEKLAVPDASRPAVSADGTAYAVLGAQRRSLLLQLPGTAEATTVLQGQPELTAPSFDPQGWVWASPTNSQGQMYAGRGGVGVAAVTASWLRGYDIRSVRVSRDGARLLIAANAGNAGFLFVSAVKRDEEGRPIEAMPGLRLMPDLQNVVDAAWVEEAQVVALGTRAGANEERPWLVQVGGEITPVPVATGATSITAGNGELTLMAGSAGGLMTRAGRFWETTPGARWPAFAG